MNSFTPTSINAVTAVVLEVGNVVTGHGDLRML
jgi:hypothetical protein